MRALDDIKKDLLPYLTDSAVEKPHVDSAIDALENEVYILAHGTKGKIPIDLFHEAEKAAIIRFDDPKGRFVINNWDLIRELEKAEHTWAEIS